jgi:hypothetical protein
MPNSNFAKVQLDLVKGANQKLLLKYSGLPSSLS